MEQNYDDEIEIDLKELFFVLLRHWVKICLAAVLVAGIVFAYCKFIVVPQYSSTSKLYVLSKSTSITSLADIQSGTSLTRDYKVVISSRAVVGEVIENLGLDDTYEQFCGRLSVENPEDTRILNITITDPSAERAKAIADEVAVVAADYIAEKMDQDAPNIIEEGYASNKKVSPSTMKNTLLGGIVGGFLAAAFIVITHLMNDTIMTPDDIEKYLGLNTLVSVPLEAGEEKQSKKKKKKVKKQSNKSSKRK